LHLNFWQKMILYNKPIYRGFSYFLAEKMQKSFLEILVDKKNEKGAWVFDQILVILHKAFDSREVQENFSFEITKVGNRIRFFVICPTKYKNFLKNQIYAQYNNVEITEIKDYLQHILVSKTLRRFLIRQLEKRLTRFHLLHEHSEKQGNTHSILFRLIFLLTRKEILSTENYSLSNYFDTQVYQSASP